MFLNKLFVPKGIIQTAEEKEMTIVVPYMGTTLTQHKSQST